MSTIAHTKKGLYVGTDKHQWWKEAVVYQIYPASFLDSNGDGWGDVPGITQKLDYLKDLGVDVIWVSPIYKSPQADMGYDIADYEDIDPSYGTLADVDNLIKEVKKRDMKLVMDLVVNHTSEEHAWFLESRSSKNSAKRDWYIWKPAKYDADGNRQPPNNWAQILGEANSAWTWDEKTQEYYLSLFTPEQPDLDWENPAVREAVHNILRFWLDRGASGFRMDVINLISKVQTFPDADFVVKDSKYQHGSKYYANGPRLHEWLKELNRNILSKYGAFTVGEMPFVRDEDEIIKLVGAQSEELNMIFSFDLMHVDKVPGDFKYTLNSWDASDLKRIVNRLQRLMLERDGWNSLYVENHDQPRSVSRFTDDSDEWREYGAKLLCLMQTTLAGTLYVYQGEEIGMRNVPESWGPEEYKDIESINFFKKYRDLYPNDPAKQALARKIMQRKARDSSRTPMQWDDSPQAGFSNGKPWMRVNDDYKTINAAAQLANAKPTPGTLSVHAFWKRALELRKKNKEVFVYGDFEMLDMDDKKVVAYRRWSEKEAFLTVLNLSGETVTWAKLNDLKVKKWVAGNYDERELEGRELSEKVGLRPWEAVLGILQ
ncbi:glycoside hydrolase family 13 protein [Cucurbitaria berberidis CBS 394.84]|uniref:Glycoside hydrolase family 13 protein n=1 Tax=Cucurbitaria berberidis CBS 394.84 TaxID=1168544 RepID=A0A9P4L9L5_9PLEO|nr:glycoside hydrolase family 13 protein [Cucurbitaria berberidis CBS 394.84]KAF1846487.1 glycoside hydrolase family 13 protein [Cucurbitaria berberidis CBS 394.84]